MARNDDEKFFLARISERIEKADSEIVTSDFLDLRQQELAQAVAVNKPSLSWHFDGGYEQAERKRLVIYPEWALQTDARIACLRISHKEYKNISLGHRDYMGAILNLGIKREKLGDIVVQESAAFLFTEPGLVDFFSQQLQRVKNSAVAVAQIEPDSFVFYSPELKTIKVSLASLRLDAGIAAAYNLSRSAVDGLIEAGHVKINQLEVYKSSNPIKAGDLISIRGQGRCRIEEIGGMTRKNRYWVQISKW